jgi:cell division protein FtsL
MRSENDMVLDIREVKTSRIFNRRVLAGIIAVMVFLISCGIFFNTTYLYAVQQLETKQKLEDEESISKKNASKSIYNIEQRLRQDLEKILQQGK